MARLARALPLLLLAAGCASSPYGPHLLDAPRPIVERVSETEWRIAWDEAPQQGPVEIFLGSVDAAGESLQRIGEMRGRSVRVIGLDADAHPLFRLVPPEGEPVFVAERLIPLEGTHNFRDLGGYETADGRLVRWGMLYRSDHLSDLTRNDVFKLSRLGIKLVCDFRSDSERARAPDRLPDESPEVDVLAIEDDRFNPAKIGRMIRSRDLEGVDFAGLLIEGNRAFATEFTEQYSAMFERIADPAYLPALVHCTAGKDRTGFAAAIVLLALGVPEETVMYDYMLSNVYNASQIERTLRLLRFYFFFGRGPEQVRPLLQVRRDYLGAALEAIRTQYGSIDAYLSEALGVDDAERERLRALLLYPAPEGAEEPETESEELPETASN